MKAKAAPSKETTTKNSDKTTSEANKLPHDPQQLTQMPLWTEGGILQRQSLQVNTPGDMYEEEADAVANQVMRMPSPTIQRRCACGGEAETDDECAACQAKGLQRNNEGDSGGGQAPASVHQTLKQSGSPLDHSTRSFMESRLGHNFGNVRVHTNSKAAQSAADVNANAYAVGNDIVFRSGQYQPGSNKGNQLIAHELVHTIQQRTSDNAVLQRNGSRETEIGIGDVPYSNLRVTMDGLHFDPEGSFRFSQGPTQGIIFLFVLKRLIGPDQYRSGLETEVINDMIARGVTLIELAASDSHASAEGMDLTRQRLTPIGAIKLIEILEERGLTIYLSDQQKETLYLAATTEAAWVDVQQAISEDFPWFTFAMFKHMMASQGTLLRLYQQASGSEGNAEIRQLALSGIIAALHPAMAVLEKIRLDIALNTPRTHQRHNDPTIIAAVGYHLIWQTEFEAALERAPEVANERAASLFMTYTYAQVSLRDQAMGDDAEAHNARVQLMARFSRFIGRIVIGEQGDLTIQDQPGTATHDPWSARLRVYPEPTPPLNQVALRTDYDFTMSVHFATVLDAFATYSYVFERVKLPDPPENQSAPVLDITNLPGERPRFSEVASTRYARVRRYNEADLQRIQEELGPMGIEAHSLTVANNILRYAGESIRLGLELLTAPRYTKQIVFPGPGMYMIRAKAVHIPGDDAEIRRMPSVSYMLFVARDPAEIAIDQVSSEAEIREQMMARIRQIQATLDSPWTMPNQEALEEELQTLREQLIPPGQHLQGRINSLEAEKLRINEAEIIDPFRLREIESELESLRTLQGMRAARYRDAGGGTRESLSATFVSDQGHNVPLTLEIVDQGEQDETRRIFISDLTTINSGQAIGVYPNADTIRSGATLNQTIDVTGADARTEAIKHAVKTLLETSSNYGRGQVAVNIDGTIHDIRIEAGTGRILSEALENATMVASLAALAAAPFTGGASLYLLIPIGIIGAAPSAYRLYNRYESHTLRLDVNSISDVLNIVSGFVGLAQVATPMRMISMGRVLMIMNFGADGGGVLMMGAGIVQQLDATRNMPPGMRRARVAEIMLGAFSQLGMLVGGSIASRHYEGMRTRQGETPPAQDAASLASGHTRPDADASTTQTPEAGGPHTTAPDAASTGQARSADVPAPDASPGSRSRAADSGRRTMTGDDGQRGRSTPDASDVTAQTTSESTRPDPRSPEHLIEGLRSGVRHGVDAPPRLPSDASSPPSNSTFRRRIRTADSAYAAYDAALAVSNGREVGIYYHAETGEYAIRLGDEGSVSSPPRESGWQAVLHYHPNPDNVLTYRMPAPADFRGVMVEHMRTGRAVREFVEFDMPGVGRGRTEFGIDPAFDKPFYVTINTPDGNTRTLRFAHDGEFSAYWSQRTTHVEPGSSTHQGMIRDIESYLRGLGYDTSNLPGSQRRSQSGDGGQGTRPTVPESTEQPGRQGRQRPDAEPGSRSAGTRTIASAQPTQVKLLDAQGSLTSEGIQFVRDTFPTLRIRGRRRSTGSPEHVTDQMIQEVIRQNPQVLERVIAAEVRQAWLGQNTSTKFAITQETAFSSLARRLQDATEGTRFSVDTSHLQQGTLDFIISRINVNDPQLRPAYDRMMPAIQENPAMLRLYEQQFYLPEVARSRSRRIHNGARRNDPLRNPGSSNDRYMSEWSRNDLTRKRPDLVEINLDAGEIHIIDATFRSDPIHQFKTALYVVIVREMFGSTITVTGIDYRSPSRQFPVE